MQMQEIVEATVQINRDRQAQAEPLWSKAPTPLLSVSRTYSPGTDQLIPLRHINALPNALLGMVSVHSYVEVESIRPVPALRLNH